MSARPANTIELNRSHGDFVDHEKLWLFGYGSLIFKADFPYLSRRIATIRGWERRFWQGSHDHRGTQQSPGRVVTLIKQPGAICHGVAYQISTSLLGQLDIREKNGYLRISTSFEFEDGSEAQGLVYIASPDNSAYLGPASEQQIASQIQQSSGPSGENRDYLLELAKALRQMSARDNHVFEIERLLLELEPVR